AADCAALPRATSPLPTHKDSSSSSRRCVHKGRSSCATWSAASSCSRKTRGLPATTLELGTSCRHLPTNHSHTSLATGHSNSTCDKVCKGTGCCCWHTPWQHKHSAAGLKCILRAPTHKPLCSNRQPNTFKVLGSRRSARRP